jgi:hypothetical protein
MNRTVWWSCALVAVVACKGKVTSESSAPGPSSTQAREMPTAVERGTPVERATTPKVDPAFVSVDGDQLRALCLASLLPRTQETPNYGALVLADGKRVPWLAFTVNEEVDKVDGKKPLLAAEWRKELAEVAADRVDNSPSSGGGFTKFRICGDGELDVVVSGVFIQKDGVHLVTARGKKQFEKLLPAKTSANEIYAAAFAELQAHTGQHATIAKHVVTGSATDNSQLSISDERWELAAK